MRACLIFNPTARGDKAKRVQPLLNSVLAGCALKPTFAPGSARALAREAVEDGYEIVIGAGGDGTINEVANGLADHPEGLQRATLGVLPLGTMNVFARELGIPLRLPAAAKVIQRGYSISIDLPEARFAGVEGPEVRRFVQLAGAGLDALAVQTVQWNLKKRLGPIAYVIAGFQALSQPQSQITASGGGKSISGELILLGNGRYYGGPFSFFPQAGLADGRIHAVAVAKSNAWALMRFAMRLFRFPAQGNNGDGFSSEKISLTSPDVTPFELDGEYVGSLPVEVSVQRGVLRVIVPAPRVRK